MFAHKRKTQIKIANMEFHMTFKNYTCMKILVVGSSNIDMIAQVDHLPAPGETVGNAKFIQAYGGKGANQAVAAARLGGEVTFITSLGNDLYSKALIKHFNNENIITKYIKVDSELSTGVALIFVASNAENCIAVAPGANYALLPAKVESLESLIKDSDIVVMQAEIPYKTISDVALLAHKNKVKVLFNPAPACQIDPELIQKIDILVLNEVEAETVSGKSLKDHSIEDIAVDLLNRGAKNVVITLGKEGVYLRTCNNSFKVPAFKVKAVDTTAAGDTFCGALAVACASEEVDVKALQFACAASAITVTKMGAQPSIPKKEEVVKFLKNNL